MKRNKKGSLLTYREAKELAEKNLPIWMVVHSYNPQDYQFSGITKFEHIDENEYYVGDTDINFDDYCDLDEKCSEDCGDCLFELYSVKQGIKR